jgi:hypothetical protein
MSDRPDPGPGGLPPPEHPIASGTGEEYITQSRPVSAEQRIREKLTTHPNAEWALVEAFDAIMAELQAAQERIMNQRSELADLNREHHRGNEFWRKAAQAAQEREKGLREAFGELGTFLDSWSDRMEKIFAAQRTEESDK